LGASSFDSVAFAEKRADGREQANAGVIEREDRAIWAARMVAFRCKEATIMVAFFAAQLCACSRCLCGGRVAVVVLYVLFRAIYAGPAANKSISSILWHVNNPVTVVLVVIT
jgi:hypothetical protein